MKKITAAILAAALIICAAGCNNGNQPSQTTQSTASQNVQDTTSATSKNVSQVAFDSNEQDTTDEALNFLESMVPLFKKYLVKRRTSPLTLETTIVKDDKTWISNIYIKDDSHMVLYGVDPDGNTTRAIYADNMAYQIEDSTKTMYAQDVGTNAIKSSVEQYKLKLKFTEVESASYSSGTGKVEGIDYNCESITTKMTDEEGNVVSQSTSVYYFDKNTDELVYIDTNSTISKIEKFENTFDRDDLFDIPTDYKTYSVDELINQYYSQSENSSSN